MKNVQIHSLCTFFCINIKININIKIYRKQMNIVTIYIPYIHRSITKEDIINVFQDEYGIGSVECLELLSEKTNAFCDSCKWKAERVESRSCDVCLLRNKRRQIGAYVQVNFNMENETARLITESFANNNVYNLRVTRYSDYEDRTTKIWCLTKTHVVLPLNTDNSPRLDVPPNTPTNSIIEEIMDNANATNFDLIYSDYDSELDSKHESVASSSSSELGESKHLLRRKLYEATQLLSIREKQIEILEEQIERLRSFALNA
jgi:hypothetical protein